MRRKGLAALLALGTVFGFAWGVRSVRHHGGPHEWPHGPRGSRAAAFEAHVADVCTRAAEKVMRAEARAPNSATP